MPIKASPVKETGTTGVYPVITGSWLLGSPVCFSRSVYDTARDSAPPQSRSGANSGSAGLHQALRIHASLNSGQELTISYSGQELTVFIRQT